MPGTPYKRTPFRDDQPVAEDPLPQQPVPPAPVEKDRVADGTAAQARLRQDVSDGDLPDHLVVGEHRARPDRAGPVSGQQAVDPLRLTLRSEELRRPGRFPRPEGLEVPHPVPGDRGGVGGLDRTNAGAAAHGLILVAKRRMRRPGYARVPAPPPTPARSSNRPSPGPISSDGSGSLPVSHTTCSSRKTPQSSPAPAGSPFAYSSADVRQDRAADFAAAGCPMPRPLQPTTTKSGIVPLPAPTTAA